MILSETEAKARWCPFARVALGKNYDGENADIPKGVPSCNRIGIEALPKSAIVPNASLCLVTGCMAWRATDNKTYPCAPGEPERDPEPAGYCGLAGSP